MFCDETEAESDAITDMPSTGWNTETSTEEQRPRCRSARIKA